MHIGQLPFLELDFYGGCDVTNLAKKCINKLYKRPQQTCDHCFIRLVASHTPSMCQKGIDSDTLKWTCGQQEIWLILCDGCQTNNNVLWTHILPITEYYLPE